MFGRREGMLVGLLVSSLAGGRARAQEPLRADVFVGVFTEDSYEVDATDYTATINGFNVGWMGGLGGPLAGRYMSISDGEIAGLAISGRTISPEKLLIEEGIAETVELGPIRVWGGPQFITVVLSADQLRTIDDLPIGEDKSSADGVSSSSDP